MGFKGKSISVANDALGRRIVSKGDDETILIWWGDSECAEYEHRASQDAIQNDIMGHPDRLNSVIARDTEDRENRIELQWYHKNCLDHVYAVSDDNGNLIEHYRYTAFGEPEIYRRRNTSAIGNTVMWNTRRYDADNGLYYYKYRHYASKLGRSLGRDPIEENGGVNLYAFVENGPINLWDILGLADIKVTIKRTYLKNETKGELSITATDPKIAKCCGSVNGPTLELPKGSYELIEYKNYFHDVKGYPIPEGDHEGKYTYSTATSPSKMAPWRNFPNRANIVGGDKNIDLRNSKFTATHMHTGTSCLSSHGCPIVGDNAKKQKVKVKQDNPGAREGTIGDLIEIHTFNYIKSWNKAIEISQFVECVKGKLNKTPSIDVNIGE